jgi:hypothetical protein
MSRPVSITIAALLQWLGAAVVLLLAFDLVVAGMGMRDSGVADEIEAALRGEGITDVGGGLVVIAMLLAGVLVGAIALVRIIVTVYLWRGRNWARMVLTVLVILSMLGGVTYFAQGYTLRAVVTIVIDVLMLYFMFNAQASAYIAAVSSARRTSASS